MSTPANFNGPDATAASPAPQESVAPSPEMPSAAPPGPSVAASYKWNLPTYLLIIANTLIFCAMLAHSIYITGSEIFLNTPIGADFDSELLRTWGSDFGPLTLSGQFWRIITSMFLHLNFLHLGGNMLFLWGFGRYIDRLFTRVQAFVIYLLTGAAGDIFSLGWHPMMNTAGASGAIYGQAGVLIALLCFARSNFSQRDIRTLLLWIFFSMPIGLLWGHVSKDADYAGHIGGILCGFVIGVLLVPAFRAPIERSRRQNQVLRFAAMALVIIFAVITQVRRDSVLEYLKAPRITFTDLTNHSNHSSEVARIFLHLKGDPKLVRYFSSLLHTELENDGIAVTSGAPEADALIHGEIRAQREHMYLTMGVVQMYINSKSGQQEIDYCTALSESEIIDLYEQSVDGAASQIRSKYPHARTVRLDPKSDMAASRRFAEELPSELKKSGFTVVQSGPADIALHIVLLPQKVPIEKDVAAYDIRAVAKHGGQLFASSGDESLFAKLAGDAPVACPKRFADLKQFYNDTTLYSVASELAENLYNPQNEPRAQKPASRPK